MIQKSIIISFLALLLVTGCSNKKEEGTKNNPISGKASNVSEIMSVSKRDNMAPNFSWKDQSGKTIDFDSFRGKVTLINFWATWCGPCKREIPDLIALSKEMADKNVKFLGISTDRGSNAIEEVRSFVADKGISFQIVISNEDIEEAYGNVRVIPTTFLIDANGKIAQTIVGVRSKEQFAEAINALLK
ncbi:MAG: TlpA disulfide reductase family protein [Bacteroidota bacterium]|nr:TlpA disulfide reductase family protein [Bacteroidota bacterium]